jgi:CubicO group peptidase (beta-lactamase class C family)
VSKTFTAVAIMQLVEQGKIDLDQDILTYLPDLEITNPYDTPVTVAHLLTHMSGLEVRDPRPDDIHTDFELFVSIEDYVADLMPPVVREPGTAYMYDNFGYLLLGWIVQEVSGEPYEDYMQTHIFEPLGMENSGFLLEGKLLDQLATGYDAAFQPIDPYVINPTIMPHGGMLSTADDLAQFMLAYLNGGVLETDSKASRILSEQSVDEMNVYRSSIHPLLPNTTYGFEAYGQFPLAGIDEAIITKLGDVPGNSSMLLMIPEENVGVFLTYNQQGVLRDLFYDEFINTFYPKYTVQAELEAFEPYTADELSNLAGYYSDLRMSVLVSKVDVAGDGSLVITDPYLGPRQLTQVDDHLFVDKIAQRFTAFELDDESDRAYMKEPYINPIGYARQGETPAGFTDVDSDNVYVPYISALQSLGIYPNDGESEFGPEEAVTRAELAYYMLRFSGVTTLSEPESYSFSDIADHPLASYIELAYSMGMVKGDGSGNFDPDRPTTRQEAAAMVWNIFSLIYPMELFDDVQLAGEVDAWAVPAVKLMVMVGYYGPELTWTEEGAADFHAKQHLTRQEAAALYHQMLLQPTDQIIAQLMQQQQAAAPADENADAAESAEQTDEYAPDEQATEQAEEYTADEQSQDQHTEEPAVVQ